MISQPWSAPDGAELSFVMWPAAGQERFRVFVLHGMGSTAYEFAILGEYLQQHQGSVLALNQRANGLDPDPRRRGHDFCWEKSREDLLAWIHAAQMPAASESQPVPCFLLGESLGALQATLLACERSLRENFSGVILLNPVMDLRQKTPNWLVALLRGVAFLFPRLVLSPFWFVHGKSAPLVLTRDPAYQEHMQTSPYRIPAYTLRHTVEVSRVMELARAAAPKIQLPLLHLVSGQDAFLDPSQAREWFERVGVADKSRVEFPEAHHILLHDWDAAAVLETIFFWISSHLPALPSAS